MTCDDILVQLLDADPFELGGRGSSGIARHVRECARCRALAGAIARETELLGAAVAQGAVPVRTQRAPLRHRTTVPWLVPATGLAGALIVAVSFEQREVTAPDQQVSRRPHRVAVAVASEDLSAVTAAMEPMAVEVRPIVAHPVEVAPVPMPAPVTPAQLVTDAPIPSEVPDLVVIAHPDPGGSDYSAARVIVTPPRGSDVRVTHARKSSITIVWITDASGGSLP